MPAFSNLPLPEVARAALLRARSLPLSYAVRAYASPGATPRTLVVLGEAHLKLPEAAEVGHAVVDSFELRGVETFPIERVALGKLLGFLIMGPRKLLRLLTLGAVRDSTIVDARQLGHGATVLLERPKKIPFSLHVASVYLTAYFGVTFAQLLGGLVPLPALVRWPLTVVAVGFQVHFLALLPAILFRRRRWAWLLHPAIAIIAERDRMMAQGTVTMLEDYPEPSAAIVIMGRAHLPGFERELVEMYGFRRLDP